MEFEEEGDLRAELGKLRKENVALKKRVAVEAPRAPKSATKRGKPDKPGGAADVKKAIATLFTQVKRNVKKQGHSQQKRQQLCGPRRSGRQPLKDWTSLARLGESTKWTGWGLTVVLFKEKAILPGPEATEMACYFGLVARGRIGSVISGLGFMLPGFALMLFLSWITFDYGSVSPWFQACMQGVVPATVALVFRGTEKIANHFLLADNDKSSKVPILERWYNVWLFVMVIFGCVQAVLRINFFITIGVSGVLGFLAFADFPIRNHRVRFAVRCFLL